MSDKEHDNQEFTLGTVVGKIDLMISKQDKLENWFILHSQKDNERFEELNKSVSSMKARMYMAGGLFIAGIEAGKASLMSWFGK